MSNAYESIKLLLIKIDVEIDFFSEPSYATNQ
jgi:hypothetical protein